MHRAPILSVLCAVALGAADDGVEVQDLRFGIGSAPIPNHSEGYFTSRSGTVTPGNAVGDPIDVEYGSSSAVNLSATATYGHLAPLGFLWGGGLRYANGKVPWEATVYPSMPGYPTSAGILDRPTLGQHVSDMSYTATGILLEAGAGCAFAGDWHAELMATGTMDWVTMEALGVSPSGVPHPAEGKGLGFSGGVRLGFYWTSETQWQFGFGGGWSRSRAIIDTSYDTSTVHSSITASGFSGYGSVGYRF